MQFVEEEIYQITESVWNSVLGREIERSAENVQPAPERFITGCVQVTGSWHGAVTVDCPFKLARTVAGIMFGVEPDKATVGDIRDALGELANITGGNIKALLPEPSYVSLPIVVDGLDYVLRLPGTAVVTQVGFECEKKPFRVTLLKWETPPAAEPMKPDA